MQSMVMPLLGMESGQAAGSGGLGGLLGSVEGMFGTRASPCPSGFIVSSGLGKRNAQGNLSSECTSAAKANATIRRAQCKQRRHI